MVLDGEAEYDSGIKQERTRVHDCGAAVVAGLLGQGCSTSAAAAVSGGDDVQGSCGDGSGSTSMVVNGPRIMAKGELSTFAGLRVAFCARVSKGGGGTNGGGSSTTVLWSEQLSTLSDLTPGSHIAAPTANVRASITETGVIWSEAPITYQVSDTTYLLSVAAGGGPHTVSNGH